MGCHGGGQLIERRHQQYSGDVVFQSKDVQVVLWEGRLDLEWLLSLCFVSLLPQMAMCSEFREAFLTCVQLGPYL